MPLARLALPCNFPASQMKTIRPLAGALVVSFLATHVAAAADSPKSKAKEIAIPGAVQEPEKLSSLPAVVAVVEGTEIAGAELEKNLNSYLASRQIPPDQLPAAEKARGYRLILEEMIKEKLIGKRAAEIKVSDAEVGETLNKLGAEEDIKQQIAASGVSIEKLRENIRVSLQQDHWLDAEIAKKGGVTDKDAEAFYKENTAKFVSPPEVRASHILLRVPSEADPKQVIEKQKAAEAIAARVKKGEDFAKLAQELSEDPSAKQNSGDLNFFPKEQMVPEFSEAAFKMKTGEISEPVRSQFGYHVIKVTDRKESETVPLDKVKPKLLAFLKTQKMEALKQEIRDKAEVKVSLPPAPAEPPAGK
jgi:peptidyl-prolyl cis-trans isomerase C